jgi:hypothetical protein
MAKLTAAARKQIPTSEFALPAERAYPIDTKARARSALSRVSHWGTPAQKSKVRAKVRTLFSSIKQRS